MTPTQRAAQLCEKALKLGLDAPSETMIADAIGDAAAQARTDAVFDLQQEGFDKAAKWLINVEELRDMEGATE